jgi:hypothetical protein
MNKKWKTRKYKGGNKDTIEQYKELLSSYAYSDAKHDFKDIYLNIKHHITDSIPKSKYNEYNEKSLLKSIKINQINNIQSSFNFDIDNIIEYYYSNNDLLFLDMELNSKIYRKYMIHVVKYQENDDIVVNTSNLFYYFGGMRTFIIDYFTMKFFDGFKNNNNNTLYDPLNPYYIIYNREMENDPAKKPLISEKHNSNNGYCLEKIIDIDNKQISYNKWNNDKLLYNTMFYSNYSFILENNPIKLIIRKNNINIECTNPKTNNSINKLKDEVKNGNITYDIMLQRKRSGDALQVLSVLDNDRKLNNMRAHNNSKMLITHDRLVLYYSILMGIDIGYTTIKYNNTTDYYLITFINQNNKFTNKFDYKKNQLGGLNKNIKTRIRTNRYTINKMKNDSYNNINKLYDKLNIQKYDNIINRDFKLNMYNYNYIINFHDIMYNKDNKNNIIKYLDFISSNNYNKEYISKLLYTHITSLLEPHIIYDTNNLSKYHNIISIIYPMYNNIKYSDKISEIIKYYNESDNNFTNYIKSISCLIWLLESYIDILVNNNTFTEYNKDKLNKIITDKIRLEIKSDSNYNFTDDEDDELDAIFNTIQSYNIHIILDDTISINKYSNIYDEVCYSCDWNLLDMNRIINYIYTHDIDVYNTLKLLAGDYYHSMYNTKPARPGIQSTAIMILEDLHYDFNVNNIQTENIDNMIKDIYNTPTSLFMIDYKNTLKILITLLKNTINKKLVWGLTVF